MNDVMDDVYDSPDKGSMCMIVLIRAVCVG